MEKLRIMSFDLDSFVLVKGKEEKSSQKSLSSPNQAV